MYCGVNEQLVSRIRGKKGKSSNDLVHFWKFTIFFDKFDNLRSVVISYGCLGQRLETFTFFFQKFNTFFSNTLRTFELFEPF